MKSNLQATIEKGIKSIKITHGRVPYENKDAAVTYHKVIKDWYGLKEHGISKKANSRFCLLRYINPDLNTRHIVELGCGTGVSAKLLYYKMNLPIYAFDSSPGMIEIANRENRINDIHFYLMDHERDLDTIFEDNSIDYIVANYSLQGSKDKDRLMGVCSKKLRKNGTLAFSIPHMGPHDLFEAYAKLLSIRRYRGEPEHVTLKEAEDELRETNMLSKSTIEEFGRSGRKYFSKYENAIEEIEETESDMKSIMTILLLRSSNRGYKFRRTLSKEIYELTIKAGFKPSFIHWTNIFVMTK